MTLGPEEKRRITDVVTEDIHRVGVPVEDAVMGEMNNNKNVLPSFPSGVIDFGRLLLQIDPNTHLCLSERD